MIDRIQWLQGFLGDVHAYPQPGDLVHVSTNARDQVLHDRLGVVVRPFPDAIVRLHDEPETGCHVTLNSLELVERLRDGLNKSVDCSSTHRKLSRADGLFRPSLALS